MFFNSTNPNKTQFGTNRAKASQINRIKNFADKVLYNYNEHLRNNIVDALLSLQKEYTPTVSASKNKIVFKVKDIIINDSVYSLIYNKGSIGFEFFPHGEDFCCNVSLPIRHPHWSRTMGLCSGDQYLYLENFKDKGLLFEYFELVLTILKTYNEDDTYDRCKVRQLFYRNPNLGYVRSTY